MCLFGIWKKHKKNQTNCAYREAHDSLRLYERFTIQPFPLPVCEIRDIAPFSVIAYPNTEPEIPQFWNKYNTEAVMGMEALLSGNR